jgi:selenium metabolism protein YedF
MERQPLDLRGKPCPAPVVETRKHLLAHPAAEKVELLLDNMAACENVSRMARAMGCEAHVEQEGEGVIRLLLTREVTSEEVSEPPGFAESTERGDEPCGRPEQVVVLIGSEKMGEGSDELGSILMLSFIKTIKEVVPRPKVLIFINGGVRLTVEGSRLLSALREIEELGVEILSCGTCLDYFGLKDELAVGRMSNMYEIATRMVTADRLARI